MLRFGLSAWMNTSPVAPTPRTESQDDFGKGEATRFGGMPPAPPNASAQRWPTASSVNC
jgi:hypothetical protein